MIRTERIRQRFPDALNTLMVMVNTHVGMFESSTPTPPECMLFSFNRWREAYRRALKSARTMNEVETILIWVGCPTIELMRKSLRKMVYLSGHPNRVGTRLRTIGYTWADRYLKPHN